MSASLVFSLSWLLLEVMDLERVVDFFFFFFFLIVDCCSPLLFLLALSSSSASTLKLNPPNSSAVASLSVDLPLRGLESLTDYSICKGTSSMTKGVSVGPLLRPVSSAAFFFFFFFLGVCELPSLTSPPKNWSSSSPPSKKSSFSNRSSCY